MMNISTTTYCLCEVLFCQGDNVVSDMSRNVLFRSATWRENICPNPFAACQRAYLSRSPFCYITPIQEASGNTIMPSKRSARESTPASVTTATLPSQPPKASNIPLAGSKPSHSSNQSPQEILLGIQDNYINSTPQRTKLIDAFMGFLAVVGALQFLYCLLAGNYVSGILFDIDTRRHL